MNDEKDAGRWKRKSSKLCTSHFAHPRVKNIVTISGQLGDDAKRYQERIVKYAVEESQK
jgi:hypothetical protein